MPVGTKDIERPLIDQSIPESAQLCPKLTKSQDATSGKDVRFPYLGPVKTSLFDHVPQDWWMDVFGDELYLKTDGDVVEDPAITQAECQDLTKDAKIANILNASGPNKVVRVLDLCCGQGRHSIELARMYPHLHLHGHDSSAFLINLAKDRTKSVDAERLHFTVGDCRYVPVPDAHFDLCIVMGNSFGYFAQENNNQAVLNEIFRVLKKGGMVVLDLANPDVIAPQQQRQSGEEETATEEAARSYSWEWIDDAGKLLCVRERETTKDRKRVASRETVIDTTKGVVRDNFYEERLYDSREVKSILQKAGFEIDRNDWARLDMNENEEMIETDTPARSPSSSCPSLQEKETWNCAQMSQRNQDLGMMAQRVLFKGTKTDGTSSLRSSPPPKPLSSSAFPHRQTPSKARRSNAASPTHLHQALTGVAAESAVSTLPSSIAVITGDPRRPCREKLNGVWNPEDVDTQERMLVALRALGFVDNVSLFHYHQHDRLFQSLSECSADLVFNLCDEGYENDATKELHIPSLLELQGIRYTGAGPIGLAVCYDKQWVNATAQKLNIDVPYEVYLKTVPPRKTTSVSRGPSRSASPLFDAAGGKQYGEVTPASIRDQIRQLGLLEEAPWPLFIKPIKGDNSIGITAQSICRTKAEVVGYIYSLTQKPYQLDEFLIQEYLKGEEYTVGIVGNKGYYSFLPILQLDYSKIKARNLAPIQGYEAKWDPESAYWSDIGYKKASLPRHQVEQLQQDCIRLFERFLCRDYARFDFRATNDGLRIKLLEVNPNPGWCWDGKMAKMVHLEMGAAGADVVPAPTAAKQPEITRAYLELIRRILEAAWKEQLPVQQAEEQRQQGQVSR